MRDLLLPKGHLIPPDLKAEFVFAGPEGYRFPTEAEARFKERMRLFMKDLYGV